MATLILRSSHPDNTVDIGRRMAAFLQPGDIISLSGDLGSGKTTLAKGVYLGLGGVKPDEVRSPTFTLINEYTASIPLYHFDFYRLGGDVDIEELGIWEYFYGEGITLVEWGDRFPSVFTADNLNIVMSWQEENIREIVFTCSNPRFLPLFEELRKI